MPLLQGGGAADPFREDLFAPRILQFLDLGIQTLLLMDGRCPSVSNFSTHLFGKVVSLQSIAPEHPFRTILGSQTPVSWVGRIRWKNPWVSEHQFSVLFAWEHDSLPLDWCRKGEGEINPKVISNKHSQSRCPEKASSQSNNR